MMQTDFEAKCKAWKSHLYKSQHLQTNKSDGKSIIHRLHSWVKTKVCVEVYEKIKQRRYLLFGGVLGHHVAEVLLLHLSLLLAHVLLVLLRHSHRIELQLLGSQSHLHALGVSSQPGYSSHLARSSRLKKEREMSEPGWKKCLKIGLLFHWHCAALINRPRGLQCKQGRSGRPKSDFYLMKLWAHRWAGGEITAWHNRARITAPSWGLKPGLGGACAFQTDDQTGQINARLRPQTLL